MTATPVGSAPARAKAPSVRRLTPRTLTRWRPSADWRWALAETTAVMLMAIGLSAWLRPQDPLWTAAPFPWLWLLAALLALRYGSAHAVWAMALALAAWLVLDHWRAPLGEFPRASFIGALVLALVAGEFSDVWNLRLLQAQNVNAYLQERLTALTQSHYLLAVSHDRVEQELLARPFSLRETLHALRETLAARAARGDERLPAADWLLALLAQNCRLEAAALHAVRDGRIEAVPLAKIGPYGADGGSAGGALEDDPMLRAALASGELMHVQSEPVIESDRPSRFIVCAPLVCADGRVIGVVLVERMAFTALTLETLQLLTVIASYYADSVESTAAARAVRAAHPDCPIEFAAELARLQRLLQSAFVRSSLVAFRLPDDGSAAQWAERLRQLQRGLDQSWLRAQGGRHVLLVLLPLTTPEGASGYLQRIASALRTRFDADLAAAGIAVRTAELRDTALPAQLAALLSGDDA